MDHFSGLTFWALYWKRKQFTFTCEFKCKNRKVLLTFSVLFFFSCYSYSVRSSGHMSVWSWRCVHYWVRYLDIDLIEIFRVFSSVVVNPIMVCMESNRSDKKPDQLNVRQEFVTKDRGRLPEMWLAFNDFCQKGKNEWLLRSWKIKSRLMPRSSSPSVQTSGIKSLTQHHRRSEEDARRDNTAHYHETTLEMTS